MSLDADPAAPGPAAPSPPPPGAPAGGAIDTAAVLVTDGGYLGPSLLVALQLHAQGLHRLADLLVFTVGVDPRLLDDLRRRLPDGVRLVELADRSFEPGAEVAFKRNHVSTTALARLVVADHLEPRHENVVYLDGDLQIVGDVAPLLRHRVRPGWIAAGRGSAWLDQDGRLGMTPAGYLESLGGVRPEGYFNSGVLAFRRDTWAVEGPRALEAYFRKAHEWPRHDQSALNYAFRDRVEQLSPAYNFHHLYASLGFQRRLAPRIIHFTGPWKPWREAVPPWGTRFLPSYQDLLVRLPELAAVFRVAAAPAAARPPSARARLREALGRLRAAPGRRTYHRALGAYLRGGEIALR